MSDQTKKIFRNTTTVWLLNTWSLYTFLLNPDMGLCTCERSLWKHISAYSICVWYIILHSIIFLLQVLAYLITVECMHWHCEGVSWLNLTLLQHQQHRTRMTTHHIHSPVFAKYTPIQMVWVTFITPYAHARRGKPIGFVHLFVSLSVSPVKN